MRRAFSRAITAGVVLAGVLALALPSGAQQLPVISLEQETVSPGDPLVVSGAGWDPRSLVNLEVCGNEALNGSADCAVATSQVTGTDGEGGFKAILSTVAPPKPCPCVVRASAQSSTAVVTHPVSIAGAATAPPITAESPASLRQFEVVQARLDGSGPWEAWFGAGPNRTLVLTIQNSGPVPVSGAEMSLAVGKGDSPSGVVAAPDIDRLEPGARQTFRIPIHLDALAFGDYKVRGQIVNLGAPVTFEASTSHYPWGLFVLAAVGLQLGLLRLRNRTREWITESGAERQLEPEPVGELMPAAVAALPAPPAREHRRQPDIYAPRWIDVEPEIVAEAEPEEPEAEEAGEAIDVEIEVEPEPVAEVEADEAEEAIEIEVEPEIVAEAEPTETVEAGEPEEAVVEDPAPAREDYAVSDYAVPDLPNPFEPDIDRIVHASTDLAARLHREADLALAGYRDEAAMLARRLRDAAEEEVRALKLELEEERDRLRQSARSAREVADTLVLATNRRADEMAERTDLATTVAALEAAREQARVLIDEIQARSHEIELAAELLRSDAGQAADTLREALHDAMSEAERRLDDADRRIDDRSAELDDRLDRLAAEIVERADLEAADLRDRIRRATASLVTTAADEVSQLVFDEAPALPDPGPLPPDEGHDGAVIDLTEPAEEVPSETDEADDEHLQLLDSAIRRAIRKTFAS